MNILKISKLCFVLLFGIFGAVNAMDAASTTAATEKTAEQKYEEDVQLRMGSLFDSLDIRVGERASRESLEQEASVRDQESLEALFVTNQTAAGSLLAFYNAEMTKNNSEAGERLDADWKVGSKNRHLYKAFIAEITHFFGWAKPSIKRFYGNDFVLGLDKNDPISNFLRTLANDVEKRLLLKKSVTEAKNRIETLFVMLNETFVKIEETKGRGFRHRGGFRTHRTSSGDGSTTGQSPADEDEEFYGCSVLRLGKGAQTIVVLEGGSETVVQQKRGAVINGKSEDIDALTKRLNDAIKKVPMPKVALVGAGSGAAALVVAGEVLPTLVTNPVVAGTILSTLCQDPQTYLFVGLCGLSAMVLIKLKRAIIG